MFKKIHIILVLLSGWYFSLQAQCNFKTYSSELLNEYHEGFYVTPEGKVVCRFFDGLSIFDGNSWKNIQKTIQQGQSTVMEENGTIWLGSFYSGLTKFVDTNNITNYDTSDGLASMMIEVISIAPDGKIWIGHWGAGISVWNGTSFTIYDTTNGLSDMTIRNIYFDKNGYAYIIGFNNQVDIFNGVTFTKMAIPQMDELSDITIAENGDIYLLGFTVTNYEYAVYRFRDGVWTQLHFTKLGAEPTIYKILTDQANDLYLATSNGLLKFDGNEEYLYTVKDGLFENNVYNMGITKSGIIYMSSGIGVTEMKQYATFNVNIQQPTGTSNEGFIVVYKKVAGVKKLAEAGKFAYNSLNNSVTVNTTGDFIIMIEPNISLNPDLVNTYYGDVDTWKLAKVINKHFCHSKTDSITVNVLQIKPLPKGNGYISGSVKSIDGTRAGSEPIKDVDVTLKKVPGGVIVNKTKTNDQGFYEFTQLDTATYAIFVEIPGLPLDSPRIVQITATNNSFKNQDYKVDSSGIKIGDFSNIAKLRNEMNAKIYPNPFRDFLNIQYYATSSSTVEIFNMSGQKIISVSYNTEGLHELKLDFVGVPKGLYLLKIQDDIRQSVFMVNRL